MHTVEKVELGVCCLILFYFISHGLHELQRHSSAINKLKNDPKNISNNLSSGWKYVARRKDGDAEWDSFCSIGLLEIVLGLSGYLVISGIISTKFRRLADYVEYDYFRLALAMLVISNLFGVYYTLLVIVIAATFYLQSKLIKSIMFSLTILAAILFWIAYFPEVIEKSLPVQANRRFLLVPMTVMLVFRCCSYCFENREYDNGNFADYFNYIFYLPTFILGPIVTYDKMEGNGSISANQQMTLANYTRAVKQLSVIIVKLSLADYILHYVYIFAVTDHAVDLNPTTTALLMSLVVVFDWAKCYFIYEIVRVLMEFDGFDGPAYPKPLFALYTFADTYFDRSLHFWVCRYFYDPNCNQGFIQETIGAAITFTFVWVSQGAGWEVGCWACLNFAGLQIESFINKRTGDTFELGVARVLKFVLLGINYMLIINANLVGIVGYDKAIKLSSFIYTSDNFSILPTLLIAYCYACINILIQNNGYSKTKLD